MQFPGFKSLIQYFFDLFFPHTCAACGSSNLAGKDGICAFCLANLPKTGFLAKAGNRVEEIFWGRLAIEHAAACCFFAKKTPVQRVLHELKYRHRADSGVQLGEWMGHELAKTDWFAEIDLIIPMPLHPKRKAVRGYNQAELLCSGISKTTGKLHFPKALVRNTATRSQTKQNRHERWDNMQGVFAIADPELLKSKHILLVDDVVTTGATLEAMGQKLLEIHQLKLSICCFAYTAKI